MKVYIYKYIQSNSREESTASTAEASSTEATTASTEASTAASEWTSTTTPSSSEGISKWIVHSRESASSSSPATTEGIREVRMQVIGVVSSARTKLIHRNSYK